MMLFLFVGIFPITFIQAQMQCCSSNQTILFKDRSCENVDSIRLNCDNEVYLLDRTVNQTDDFVIIHDTILVLKDGMVEFPPTDYCIGEMRFEDDEPPHSIALVCYRKYKDIVSMNSSLSVMFIILKIISLISLIITCLVYLTSRYLKDLHSSCLLQFLLSYTIMYFTINILDSLGLNLCPFKAYFFYFFTMSSLAWFCIITLNTWVDLSWTHDDSSKLFIIYLILSYGWAIIFLILILIVQYYPGNHSRPNFTVQENCWFLDIDTQWWYYYLPITIIIVASILFLIDSYRKIFSSRTGDNAFTDDVKKFRNDCFTNLKLIFIIDFAWVLEILNANVFDSNYFLSIAIDVVNSIQGILILIILVTSRQEALIEFLKFLSCRCTDTPNGWTLRERKNQVPPPARYSSRRNNEFVRA